MSGKGDDGEMNYRVSHVNRGDTYDATLAAVPFDSYMARWEAKYASMIVRDLFPNRVPRYLDFACGTGRMTQSIEPLAAETVGVDVSPTMLRVAREKMPGVRFIEQDLTASQPDIGTFDLVTSFRFFGNAEHSLRVAVLNALNGVLRPGGYLLINNHRNPRCLASVLDVMTGGTQLMDLTHAKLQTALSDAGFGIVRRKPIAAWQFRSKVMNRADRSPAQEESLERIFGSEIWVPIAPDAIILARKVRDVPRIG